jgi:lantibiotic modifying enzyme
MHIESSWAKCNTVRNAGRHRIRVMPSPCVERLSEDMYEASYTLAKWLTYMGAVWGSSVYLHIAYASLPRAIRLG